MGLKDSQSYLFNIKKHQYKQSRNKSNEKLNANFTKSKKRVHGEREAYFYKERKNQRFVLTSQKLNAQSLSNYQLRLNVEKRIKDYVERKNH